MSRGRHQKPSQTGRNIARLTIAGMPVLVAATTITMPASASTFVPEHVDVAPAPVPTPAAPAPVADDTPTEEFAVVQPNDTLGKIAAARQLGDWHPLYEQNRDVIGDNPNLIMPGQRLRVSAGKHAAPEVAVQPQAKVTELPQVQVQTEKPPVPAASSSAASVAMGVARAQLGKAYVWAGAGPNTFDCSGLVQFAYKAAGVSLPHSSAALAGVGRPVSRAALQPGDIVAYSGHVGLYAGDGQVLQAANPQLGVVTKPIDWAGSVVAMRRVG